MPQPRHLPEPRCDRWMAGRRAAKVRCGSANRQCQQRLLNVEVWSDTHQPVVTDGRTLPELPRCQFAGDPDRLRKDGVEEGAARRPGQMFGERRGPPIRHVPSRSANRPFRSFYRTLYSTPAPGELDQWLRPKQGVAPAHVVLEGFTRVISLPQNCPPDALRAFGPMPSLKPAFGRLWAVSGDLAEHALFGDYPFPFRPFARTYRQLVSILQDLGRFPAFSAKI
jgi:hypothetical protein